MAQGLSKPSKLYIFFCSLNCVHMCAACICVHVCVGLWLCKGVYVLQRAVVDIVCPYWLLSSF